MWGRHYHGTLDYVTGWHAKAIEYFGQIAGRWAFVTTNSITQGEAVAPLFGPILGAGWPSRSDTGPSAGHRRPGASGRPLRHNRLSTVASRRPRLFDYEARSGRPAIEVPGVKNISPYLTDGPPSSSIRARNPLNRSLGEVAYGNKPTETGDLVVEPDDYAEVVPTPSPPDTSSPTSGPGANPRGQKRYCLWLVDATTESAAKPRLRSGWRGYGHSVLNKQGCHRLAASRHTPLVPPDCTTTCALPVHSIHVTEDRPYFLRRTSRRTSSPATPTSSPRIPTDSCSP